MQASISAKRRRTHLLALAIAAAPFMLCSTASADRYWQNGVTADTWSSTTDWSATSPTATDQNGPPGSADNAFITNTDALNEVVTLDQSDTILSLQVGNTGGGSDTLLQNSASNLSMDTEQLGAATAGIGAHYQSAGTNTYYSGLVVGSAPSSVATYSLTGSGSIDFNGTGSGAYQGLYVGNDGSGTFSQGTGTDQPQLTDNQSLYVGGYSHNGTGTYFLNSGTLVVYGGEVIGNAAAGTFNQSGGVNTVSSGIFLYNGGADTYSLSGGTLTTMGNSIIGGYGRGSATFSQSGGVYDAMLGTNIGFSGPGTYLLSNGTLNSADYVIVGYFSPGTFNQSGGACTIGTASQPEGLEIGIRPGSASSGYALSRTGSLTVNGNVYVGGDTTTSGAASTLAISGGSMGVTNATTVYGGSTLTQSGGTIAVGTLNLLAGGTVNQSAGSFQAGSVTQSGGVATFTTIGVATSGGNIGLYSLSAGSLNTATASIGNATSGGTFTQTNGTDKVGTLNLAAPASGSGLYNLQTGTLNAQTININSGGNLRAGYAPSFTFTLAATNINVNAGGQLHLGDGVLYSGSYYPNMTNLIENGGTIGGEASVSGNYTYDSGDTSNLILDISGFGTATVNNWRLYQLIWQTSSTLSIPAGTSIQASSEFLGGSISQNGGTDTSADIYIGNSKACSMAATGTGNVGSSVITASSFLEVGGPQGDPGTLSLSGGAQASCGVAVIGAGGGTGGTGDLTLGSAGNVDTGSSFQATGSTYIGGTQTGTLGGGVAFVYGGTTFSSDGALKIWNSAGTKVNLAGGTIQAGTLDASGNAALFNWTSGTLNVSNSIINMPTLTVPNGGVLTGDANVGAQTSVAAGGRIMPRQTAIASAQSVTFDDVNTTLGYGEIFNGYAGLNWSGFLAENGAMQGGGFAAGTVSAPNVAYNVSGNASFSSTTLFELASLDLTAAWNDGLSVTIDGYNGSTLVDATTVHPSATAPTLYTLDFTKLTSVTIA